MQFCKVGYVLWNYIIGRWKRSRKLEQKERDNKQNWERKQRGKLEEREKRSRGREEQSNLSKRELGERKSEV